MTPRASTLATGLLRAIAIGAPLFAVGCSCYGPCPEHSLRTFALTSEQFERIRDTRGTIDGGMSASGRFEPDCAPFCRELGGSSISTYEYVSWCDLGNDAEGAPALLCRWGSECIGGRRPAGLIEPGARALGIGASLARTAHLEAASVPAFLELARELELHGAHPALARAARRSARDEVRHARAIGSLARAYGATVPSVERTEVEPRSRRELARDNAIEGCAREAYAALVAAHQAQAARDPRIARAYAAIARDEARHALLSFAIHDALGDRRSEDARREAIADVAREAEREASATERVVLGLPRAERAVELALALA